MRGRRRLLALVLAAVAVGLVIVEPFPKGTVLFSLTATHGVDAGDLTAVAVLLTDRGRSRRLALSSAQERTRPHCVSPTRPLVVCSGQPPSVRCLPSRI
jgi:hypothetical protein